MTHLIGAVKEKHKLHICLSVHFLVPTLKVVCVAREAIDEETKFLTILLNGFLHGLKKQTQD